jgi:hypothetical protein
MIRIISAVSALLLTMTSAIHAQDREPAFLDLDFKQRHLHSLDREISLQEYEEIYSRNQKYVRSTLKTYTKHALGLIGVSEQVVNITGAALGLVTRGAKLDLNESKTLVLEFKDVSTGDRGLYFGVNLDW